ncbi:unnamed protein product [Dracunculus medinensis]|uniref:Alpha-mann_mid domain-containing protein n=1 Tax=Dracunculus medinensis TaxID=318479 RepID=A0A158Q4Y2_DRAME|nr:unnamed protein product [Dracunculus medinensis]
MQLTGRFGLNLPIYKDDRPFKGRQWKKITTHPLQMNSAESNDETSKEMAAIRHANTEFVCQQRIEQSATNLDVFDLFANHVGYNKPFKQPNIFPDDNQLEVFVLPMTHVDPGWLRTVESYSKDTNKILNNMLHFMPSHSKMRFLWCEMVFFEKWWSKLNESSKKKVRKLIGNGQLEIASGSWVMTDEANPYFPVTIDNIIEGQQFTFRELGVKSKTIWSNDPFGYGPSVPYLFSKTGIKRAVINRIHDILKKALQARRAIPFKWRQHFDKQGVGDIHTHVLPYSHYDILNSCGPNQSVCCAFDFKRITHYQCYDTQTEAITKKNVKKKAQQLENQLKEMSEMYKSKVLLVMWGDDFRYDMMEEWHQQYENLVYLFNYINAMNKIKIRFGTFTEYFDALDKFNEENKIIPTVISGDFFPYLCAAHDYWTGYYTTRPFYKRQERQLHALIRSADLLTSYANHRLNREQKTLIISKLRKARRNLSLFQHHDAITVH